MLSVKDLVLWHLEHTFEKEAWQPSLVQSLEGLSAAQAAWKPAPERHSVWQIVRHVTRWKQALMDNWNGVEPDYDALDRTDWQEVSGDEAAWAEDIQALHDISRRFHEIAESLTEEAALAPMMDDSAPTAIRFMRMATHDIYHAGQIRYVRALQAAQGAASVVHDVGRVRIMPDID